MHFQNYEIARANRFLQIAHFLPDFWYQNVTFHIPKEIWNVLSKTSEGLRTNHQIDAWHGALQDSP